jgi:hypothetical protein
MAKAESKNAVFEEISEKLEEICSSMESIEERLDDITMSCSMLVFFRLVELRPDMKDKLMPLIDDMVEAMDFNMPEE